jgi:peroxiredoxin Q/BCP
VRLSDFRGKKVVLYFDPKDMSPGCTCQACAFRETLDGFPTADITVIGINRDSVASHRKFTE